MRSTRRRTRHADPLASPESVRLVLASLKSAMPEVIPDSERKVLALLRAARHVQRYSATDTKRGRTPKYDRSALIKVASRLGAILDRETSSRISFGSFVDHYLRLLDFPSDVLDALRSGDINLFEAAQLARLTPARLGVPAGQAKRTRRELLTAHLAAHNSSTRLRLRVNELLGATSQDGGGGQAEAAAPLEAELEIIDDYDSTHLFWDQLTQLVLALREIKQEDVTEEELDELLETSEPLMNVLARIQRKKERKVMKLKI